MLTIVQAFLNPFFFLETKFVFAFLNADFFIILLIDCLISLRGKSQEAMTTYRRDFLFTLDLVIIIVFNYTYINKEQHIIK